MKKITASPAILCGLSLIAYASGVYAQNTSTVNAQTSQAEQNTPPVWVQCTDESATCVPGTPDLVTTRYGEGGTYFFWATKNVEQIPCNNSVQGDPKPGTDKSCQYTTENVLGVPDSTYQWSQVAAEGESFDHAPSGTFWVRYGALGSYAYSMIRGGNTQTISCSNSYFGLDPIHEDKICEIGPEYTLGATPLEECAKENQTCYPDIGTTLLLRFGADQGWETRLYRSADGAFPCENKFFGHDPIHENKACFFQPLNPAFVRTEGVWQKVGSCSGNSCDSITETITYGTSKTSQWSTTTQWSKTVTDSMSGGFLIQGVGGKVDQTVARSFSESSGFQDALNTSRTETLSHTCKMDGATIGLVYQFRTETDATCIEDGSCTGTTLTHDVHCVTNPPPDYAGPQCVPGYCADTLCTTCRY